ncbi:MAG: flagellar biosynthesis anti-sigma factor FlgM [Acidobacteria bacterium]|nr:flagellar biosynthesis anti-sigma factor FlgM [Acidobacteriota bacterium]
MRIDLNNAIAQQLAAEKNSTHKGGKPQPSPLPPEDKATFSNHGPSIHQLVQSALHPSTVRQERIAALRDAVNSGTYSVDADAAANAMIRESSGN